MNKEPTAWRDPFRTTIPWNPERDQIQFKHFSVRYRRIYKSKFFKLSCSAYLYVGMFHRPCHWYGFIESQPSVFMPQYIPKPLHTSTSIIHCARKNRRKWGKNRNLKCVTKKREKNEKEYSHGPTSTQRSLAIGAPDCTPKTQTSHWLSYTSTSLGS